MPNSIVADVAGLRESELQTITRKLDESRNEKEKLKRENEALKLVNEQLTTQLNEKTKQLDTNEKEVDQLRRELQVCTQGSVHADRLQEEFNAFSGLFSVCILYFLVNFNRL